MAPPARASARVLLLAAVGLHLLAYGRSLPNFFTFDDRAIILESRLVRGDEPLAGVLRIPYFGTASQYRPAALGSLGLDVRVFGPSAWWMRLENLVWAGVGAALFAVLLARLGAPPPVVWASLLLVSVHPVRSEAVVSIVGRSELLGFTFVNAALLLALASAAPAARRLVLALLSALCLVVALLSKENTFVAPVLLALSAALPGRERRPPLRGFAAVAGLWALGLFLVLLARHAVLGGFVAGPANAIRAVENPLALLPAPQRLAAAIAVLPTGFARLVWPATLVADYGSRSFAVERLLEPGAIATGAVLLGAVVLLAVLIARRLPLAAFGIGWALVWWLPFANLLVPTPVVFAERLLFAPAAGIALAAAALLFAPALPRLVSTAVVLALAAIGALRIQARIPEWRDDQTLFAATVRDVPGNGRAWTNLAVLALGARDDAAAAEAAGRAAAADPSLCPRLLGLADRARTLGRDGTARLLEAALTACPRR